MLSVEHLGAAACVGYCISSPVHRQLALTIEDEGCMFAIVGVNYPKR